MPTHFFAANPLDRVSELRKDQDWVAAKLADPASRFLPLWKLDALVKSDGGGLAWARRAVCDSMNSEVGAVLLGVDGEVAHFAVDVSGLKEPLKELGLGGVADFADLRASATRLSQEEGGVVAQARALLEWHGSHRYCPACGDRTDVRWGGTLRVCVGCSAEQFPRVNPVAIAIVSSGDRCLLARQRGWPEGMYSALAGFIEPGETLEEAVRREIFEEAGIRVGDVRYHSAQPWPFPSSLMLGCLGEAENEDIVVDTTELEEAHWFDRQTVLAALEGKGPDGLFLPPPFAVAHHLAHAWAYGA